MTAQLSKNPSKSSNIAKLNALADWKLETLGTPKQKYYPRRLYITRCFRCKKEGAENQLRNNCESCGMKGGMVFKI